MYSKEIKEKVLYLLSQGETVKRVQEILSKENEITISMPTIYSWKKKAIGVSKEEQSKVSKEEEQPIEKDKVKKDDKNASQTSADENYATNVRQDEIDSSNESDVPKRDIKGKRTFNSSNPVYKDKNIEMLVNVIAKIKLLINQKLFENALNLCEKYTTEYYANKYPRQVSFLENQKLQTMIGLRMNEEALKLEEELERKYPWNTPAFRIQKIRALTNNSAIAEVRELSKKYEEEYPKVDFSFASLRVKAYLQCENYNEALKEVENLIEKYGTDYFCSQKISALIGLERYGEAIEISKTYENELYTHRKFKNASILASQRVTALMQIQNYEEAEKEAKIAIKKYPFVKTIFESQIITILAESKGEEEVTRAVEIFKRQSPEKSAIYDSQLVEALISAKQFQEAIEKSHEFEKNYGIIAGEKFASQKIKALMASGKLDEAEKEAIESKQKYPKNGENFALQRLNILIEKGELERAKKIARELITKYPKSETIWLITIKKINDKIALEKSKKNDDNPTTTVTSSVDKKTSSAQATKEGSKNETASPKEIKDDTKTKAVNKESSLSGKDSNSEPQVGKDTDTPQPAEKPKASLQKILEMSEEEFETYAKTLPNRETLFAVVARSKKQNQDKLAIGYIDMYLKKHENADSDLAKQLKTMAKAKTPIFDTAKWDALAKRFNLDFNSGAKTLLRQMVELAKQINNHPFDLQIDKETLLAIQQLTKLSLSPDYPDEGQKIEIER